MARHKEIPAVKIPPGSIRGEWKFCAEDVDKALMVKKEKTMIRMRTSWKMFFDWLDEKKSS